MKTIKVILEKGKDGYGVSFYNIPNVYGFGETIEAAKEDAYAALKGFKAMLEEYGKPIPEELAGEFELEFEVETETLMQLISGVVTKQALAKASGINASQLSHYASGLKKPRPEQRKKIIDGLHKLGEELLSVS